jgi:hypothetical protein
VGGHGLTRPVGALFTRGLLANAGNCAGGRRAPTLNGPKRRCSLCRYTQWFNHRRRSGSRRATSRSCREPGRRLPARA